MIHTLRKILICLLLSIVVQASAQDVIVKRNGEQIVGKVIALSSDSVTYRYISDANGPVQSLVRNEVIQLKLASSPSLNEITEPSRYINEQTSITELAELRTQARIDAETHYKARGVFWTIMGSTIMHPAAGFATGVLVSAIPPEVDSDHNPNRHLMKEPVYRETYQKQARKHKIAKAAAGFGAGATVLSAIYMIIVMGIVAG
jgi:hypothetical protein